MLEMRSVTDVGRATDHPVAEHGSETEPGGPEEAGAHQVLFGLPKTRWGWKIELLGAPINCCFGSGAPELRCFRESVAEPPGHLVCQSWGTSC